jgi:bifunctional oligoribonuclease and PAP phosphatase NrnA
MKPVPEAVRQILDLLAKAHTVCVVGHVRPDGDCIGSQLGLALVLEGIGKEVTIWNQDSIPDKLRFLDPDKRVRKPQSGHQFDVVIAVDCASRERLGRVADHIAERGTLVNIDHHASNTQYGDLNWVSPDEPSSGELVHNLCRWAGWPINPQVANCLFTAVSTDTGSFQYPSTTPETLRTAAELIEDGAELGRICHEVYQSFPLTRVKLLRHVYNRFHLVHADRTAYFWLKKADYSRTGASTEESEGLIDHIRAIEGVMVAVVFEEIQPELTRISFRSKVESVDVNAIAALFGGGGHAAAAGARVQGKPLSVQRRVLNAIRRALNSVS